MGSEKLAVAYVIESPESSLVEIQLLAACKVSPGSVEDQQSQFGTE